VQRLEDDELMNPAPEVRGEIFFARLQRARAWRLLFQTFHVWLPYARASGANLESQNVP
jgi:hypothetical protein